MLQNSFLKRKKEERGITTRQTWQETTRSWKQQEKNHPEPREWPSQDLTTATYCWQSPSVPRNWELPQNNSTPGTQAQGPHKHSQARGPGWRGPSRHHPASPRGSAQSSEQGGPHRPPLSQLRKGQVRTKGDPNSPDTTRVTQRPRRNMKCTRCWDPPLAFSPCLRPPVCAGRGPGTLPEAQPHAWDAFTLRAAVRALQGTCAAPSAVPAPTV